MTGSSGSWAVPPAHVAGSRQHFYVPPYDGDLCWHTHMLASSCAYHEETRVRAGEPEDLACCIRANLKSFQ